MRNSGIEIRINTSAISKADWKSLKKNFDVQYYKAIDEMVLWVHDDGYKPFTRELFNHLGALKSVYNRRTKTTHLDLFIETTKDNIDKYSREITLEDGTLRYFKNLIPEDLFSVDLKNVILKKECNNARLLKKRIK